MTDKADLICELKTRIAKLPPLEDEPDFSTDDETIIRFLKSRNWNLDEAEQMLSDSIEYRRRTRPQELSCSWCHNRPGFHSMRQVGHDEAGRPVMYANFAQASTVKINVDDAVTHVTYLIEQAKRTMPAGVSTWVFVIDCTGMTLSCCNPKLGYNVSMALSDHYPERLGLVICLNHNPVFHAVWGAIRKFLHPQTAAKVKLVRSKAKTAEVFSQVFSPELTAWLLDEVSLNKQKPMTKAQSEFWNPPPLTGSHDPRGCPAYVRKYVDCCGGVKPVGKGRAHKPHPNIVDRLSGRKVAAVALSEEEERERLHAESLVDGEMEGESSVEVDIPSDLQIPNHALPLVASS